MIINSQFFITYYTGKNPLSLKTLQTGLSSTQRADYERFIQSISAIYASQGVNGKIPKFWTKLTEVNDTLGNKKYTYIPHPDSDLEFLSPRLAYYFIVRDESAIPLRIPAIGGSLLGFTDTSMLPYVIPSSLNNITLNASSGNIVSISPMIENLQPYEEYTYQFKSVDANWPVSVNPESGILKPSTSSGLLNARVSFCMSSGSCDSNSLDYTLQPSCLVAAPNDNDKYAIMVVSVTPKTYSGPEVLSNQFTITCDDCLPKPRILLQGSGQTNLTHPASPSDIRAFDFTINVSDVHPNQTYKYSIETLDAQWPTMFIGQRSGLLEVKNSPPPTMVGKIVFCYATGICKPGSPNVNPYNIPLDSYPKSWTQPKIYNVLVRAKLENTTCPTNIVYSNPILLTYQLNQQTFPAIDLEIA